MIIYSSVQSFSRWIDLCLAIADRYIADCSINWHVVVLEVSDSSMDIHTKNYVHYAIFIYDKSLASYKFSVLGYQSEGR